MDEMEKNVFVIYDNIFFIDLYVIIFLKNEKNKFLSESFLIINIKI